MRFTPLRAMKEHGGVEVQLQSFLTSALYGGSSQFYDMAALTPGKALGAQRIEFCVRHRAGLEAGEGEEFGTRAEN